MMRTIFAMGVFVLAGLAAPGQAAAQTRADVKTEYAESALYPVRGGFAPGETTWFVLEQDLREGWHVYWKNPGDSGLPLDLTWTLPEGYEAGEAVYPTPERIPVGPLANFGHHGRPAFLVPVTAPASASPGEDVEISLIASWLICEEICVPEEGTFELVLPVDASPATDPQADRVAGAARAAAPEPFDADAVFQAGGDAVVVAMKDPGGALADAYFFPEAEGLIEPAAEQRISREDGRLVVEMTPGFNAGAAGDGLRGVLALVEEGERRGYEIEARASSAPIVSAAAAPAVSGGAADAASTTAETRSAGGAMGGGMSLPLLLAAAFFGGVILNVMPCVFPVIFIKAASLIKGAGAPGAVVRRDGVLYAAGVVATFAVLGGLLLALRAGGAQLGWGFHLQSPIVVLASAYVLFLVGLNLAGVFHVGASLQGVGSGLAASRGGLGAFFTGVLAVFVAAPCIGPLLAAPVGAAVLLQPAAGMAIFLLMGLGLAAPYVVLAFVPALGRMLPRPGAWMDVFKQALAFPVFAAAAYFLWVLAQQTGPVGLGQALGGAILLALAVWLFELSKAGARRRLVQAAAALALLGAILPLGGLEVAGSAQARADGSGAGLEEVAFDPERIAALRAEGQGVFVDFTAAWCVVCQYNKLTIFSRPGIEDLFASNNVAFVVADWTRRDPVITEALAEFGANGVPFYVFYPPEGEAQVLPLPLTEAAVVRTVRNSS